MYISIIHVIFKKRIIFTSKDKKFSGIYVALATACSAGKEQGAGGGRGRRAVFAGLTFYS